MGKRRISAKGAHCDNVHRNVLHLEILPNAVDRLLARIASVLPAPLSALVRSWFPEWFLPPRIILKRQKRDWDEEFDNEKAIYQALSPIQGKIVPVCYGEATCPETESTTTRALVLSDVGGVSLHEDAAAGLGVEQLETMLRDAFRPLAEFKVCHDDFKLDNYRLVGDRIVIIDFDSSYVFETEDPEFVTFRSTKFVSRLYNNAHQGGGLFSLR